MPDSSFNLDCRQCKRLDTFLKQVKGQYPDYHSRPVAPFGVARPDLLIVGLAPGLHGANATGRPFTGDYAGILLYESLYKYGFSTKPESVSQDDGLKLKRCRITNAVKCLPPENKPTGAEVNTCNGYLANELAGLKKGAIILVLGGIAHKAVIKGYGLRQSDYPFGHGKVYDLPDNRKLVTSYHCSRYNTSTKRLTEKMFHQVFEKILKLMEK